MNQEFNEATKKEELKRKFNSESNFLFYFNLFFDAKFVFHSSNKLGKDERKMKGNEERNESN